MEQSDTWGAFDGSGGGGDGRGRTVVNPDTRQQDLALRVMAFKGNQLRPSSIIFRSSLCVQLSGRAEVRISPCAWRWIKASAEWTHIIHAQIRDERYDLLYSLSGVETSLRVTTCMQIVGNLPEHNYIVLKYLTCFLHMVKPYTHRLNIKYLSRQCCRHNTQT